MALSAGTSQEHRYQLCRDDDCERFPCRVYKEGWRNGYQEGWERGYAAGYAAGYAQGFPDGVASCPRPHK